MDGMRAWLGWLGVGALSLVAGCQGGGVEIGGRPIDRAGAPSRVERLAAREEAIELLASFAQHERAELRANAIEGLQPARSRVAPIARAALHDENPGVRFVALMTVGELELREAAPAAAQLTADPSPDVRMAAIYALRRTGAPVDPTPLADFLWSPDPRIRRQAAFVLGELGQVSAAPMLRDAARQPVRGTPADRLLLDLQMAEAQIKLGDAPAAHSVLSRLYPSQTEGFEGAVLAAQIIGTTQLREGARQLVNLIDDQAPDGGMLYPPELRIAAASSLAKLGYPDGGYVADAYIESGDPRVRSQAALLYGDLGAQREIPRLRRMMTEDPTTAVRLSAAAAVLRLAG